MKGTMRHRAGRQQQAGMTTLGLIILVAFVALFAFAGLRLTPVYLNHLKVAGAINGVYEEFDGQNPSRAAIRNSIVRRFGVESVSHIAAKDIKITQEEGGFKVAAVYESTTPFIANISFTVHFNKTVLVRR